MIPMAGESEGGYLLIVKLRDEVGYRRQRLMSWSDEVKQEKNDV